MKKLLSFLSYNNAVPITISLLLLGAGTTFAATNPDTILSSQQRVVSVDNTYIAHKDLTLYTPRVQITGITEDVNNYYVVYAFMTIDVQNNVWQDVTKQNTMTVAKAQLGPYGDLGVYVTEQLKQNIDHEIDRLKEEQVKEGKDVTQKVVATVYGGLVGKILTDTTETFPGYTPVVVAPVPAEAAAAIVASNTGGISDQLAVSAVSSEQPLSRSEVEELIRQQVAALMAANQNQTGGTGGGTSASAIEPVITSTPAAGQATTSAPVTDQATTSASIVEPTATSGPVVEQTPTVDTSTAPVSDPAADTHMPEEAAPAN